MANRIETGLIIKGLSGDTNALYVTGNSFINGDVNITGNVNVIGTATTLNTEVVQTRDNKILLNFSGTNLTAIGGGIEVLSAKTDGTNISLTTDVNGDWNSNTGLNVVGRSDNSTSNGLKVTSSGGTDNLVVRNDGNVGIGGQPTYGSYKLQVLGDFVCVFGSDSGTKSTQYRFGLGQRFTNNFFENNGGAGQVDYFNSRVDSYFDNHRFLKKSGTEIMRVGDGGASTNVGIGTAGANARLQVKGDGTGTTDAFLVENSSLTELLSVRNDGFVSVYNASQQFGENLAVNGTVRASNNGYLITDGGGYWQLYSSSNTFGILKDGLASPILGIDVNNPYYIFTNSNYNFGIGTSTPTEKLEVSGKTKTQNLQITSGATAGYVLTSLDNNGNTIWQAPYTFTGNTSATCITDLYVDNLYGCSPITIHDSIQSTGSTASGILSFAFGDGTTALGDYSHAEGDDTMTGILTAFSADSVNNGLIVLNSSYGDLSTTGDFNAGNKLFLYEPTFFVYSKAVFPISAVTYDGTNTLIQLYDITVTTPNAYVGEVEYLIQNGNWTGNQEIKSYASHTEGIATKTLGDYSHSENGNNYAIGLKSHAEGEGTASLGTASHTEGRTTIASGDYSHSEGRNNQSIGIYSHSEGRNNQSIGTYSHAEGNSNISGWKGFGIVGAINNGVVTINSTYGDVTSEFTPSNGIYLGSNNGVVSYTISATTWDGTNTIVYLNAAPPLIGIKIVADVNNLNSPYADNFSGDYSHAEGFTNTTLGVYSHTEGRLSKALGNYSHAEGQQTKALGSYSHTEGYNTITDNIFSHAEGNTTRALSIASHSEGEDTTAGWKGFQIASVSNGVIALLSSYYDVTTEFSATAVLWDGSVALPYSISATTWDGTNTIVYLSNTTVNSGTHIADVNNLNSEYANFSFGDYSHAEGDQTKALGLVSHTEGSGTITYGNNSHAEGSTTQAIGNSSHAEGKGAQAIGDYSHAEGYQTDAGPNQAIGIGSHVEGLQNIAIGIASHAEGIDTETIGDFSHTEGFGTQAIGNSSHAEGSYTKTGVDSAFSTNSVTNGLIILNPSYGDVTGYFAQDNLLYLYTPAPSYSIFTISAVTFNSPSTEIQLYDTSVSALTAYVGDLTYLSANNTFSGDQIIPGPYSHSEGNLSLSLGPYSHAEGNLTQAVGPYSHSEGFNTRSYGLYSHSEGSGTITSGQSSHAEGDGTQAKGDNSHAEGSGTQAVGNSSHAEGKDTIATGGSSHTEGNQTQAIGDYSHAEGDQTQAIGLYSHAEGRETVASGDYQHVSGQYNLTATTQSAFIIGNGTNSSNRSNLLFAAGNEVNISGKVVTTTLQVTSGATNGYVLTSDANGNGSWQPSSSLMITSGTTTGLTAFTLSIDVNYYGVNHNSDVDITLPNASGFDGYNINIKDESGNAGIYRIRITPSSGLIDGTNYVDMNTNYMSLHVIARNNNWWII